MIYNQGKVMRLDVFRLTHEEAYNAMRSLSYFYNDLTRDAFLQARNVSMLVAEGKTYEESVEICYPDECDKKFIVENAMLFDNYCKVIKDNGFNVEPTVNANGSIEINLVSIKG